MQDGGLLLPSGQKVTGDIILERADGKRLTVDHVRAILFLIDETRKMPGLNYQQYLAKLNPEAFIRLWENWQSIGQIDPNNPCPLVKGACGSCQQYMEKGTIMHICGSCGVAKYCSLQCYNLSKIDHGPVCVEI